MEDAANHQYLQAWPFVLPVANQKAKRHIILEMAGLTV